MKRWIIRSFFIALLLLCVGGWVGSYHFSWAIRHDARDVYFGVRCYLGKVHVAWLKIGMNVEEDGWSVFAVRADEATDDGLSSLPYRLGFFIQLKPDVKAASIPFWFPTTLSAALLWWVWRKTPSKATARAFPVEPSKPIGTP